MRAAVVASGRIEMQDRPDPVAQHGEALIRVAAAGLNAGDLAQVRGEYPAPPGWTQEIPGLEIAGVVAALGPGCRRVKVGDRVMAVVGGGGQAELVAVPEEQLMPIPRGLSFAQAAAIPEAFMTAHDALFRQCHLEAGEHLLVHAGAGGVGTAAIELGRAAGARVTTTVRNADLRPSVAALGCHVVPPEEFEASGPYDVIIDLIGGEFLERGVHALAAGGRICALGFPAGDTAELDISELGRRGGSISASRLRPRPLEQKAMAARRLETVLPLFETGALRPHVSAEIPLRDVAEAYERLRRGGHLGKIVLTME